MSNMYLSSILRAIKRSAAVSIALAIGFLSATSAAQEVFTFKSLNYQDRYIRHASFVAELTPLNSELDKEDAKFIQRPALSGTPGAVSFEAANHRGYYLRHQDFILKLQSNDGTPSFNADASFIPRPGLANPAGMSYESVNFPRHFIRHVEFHVVVNEDDGSKSDFWRDATFLRAGAPLAECERWDLSGEWKVAQDNGWTVSLRLTQNETKIGGKGSHCEACGKGDSGPFDVGPDPKTTDGTVSGTTDWDKFIFAIRWPDSKLGGEYQGEVHADGTITGITVNQDIPTERFAFHSASGFASCANAGPEVAPSASTPPSSRPTKALGKKKLPTEPAATSASKSGAQVDANQRIGNSVSSGQSGICASGFVFRDAGPNDHICVTPGERALAASENTEASTHVDPNGAYGPNTCLSGYVWRAAFDGDAVCVTPAARDRVAAENRLGASRRAGQ